MEILITGGAGFIGGHLAAGFLRDGHSVCVVDVMDPFYDLQLKRRTIQHHRNVAAQHDGEYTYLNGDIRDEDIISDLVSDADAVYHQAGKAGVRPSVDNPTLYADININGTLTLLEASRNTELDAFVFASSSSVYGGRSEYLPFAETDPALPVSPYGVSKLAAERYVCAYHDVYEIPTVALRYFTVYGPRMRPNMAISNFVSRCFTGKSPIIYGDGTQTRDFTYIEDVIDANRTLLDLDAANGKAINIGSTDRIDIKTLATEIRDQIDPDLSLQYGDRYAADAAHTHADTSRAASLLGYDPVYSIREGVSAFIEWYQSNRDWYEPLVID
jgi:Nucleoside-diphosphate-sugar epimerases